MLGPIPWVGFPKWIKTSKGTERWLSLCFLRIQSDQVSHTPAAMTSLHDGLYPQTVIGNPHLFPSITFFRRLDTAVQKRTKAEASGSMNFSKPICWPGTSLIVWYGRHFRFKLKHGNRGAKEFDLTHKVEANRGDRCK